MQCCGSRIVFLISTVRAVWGEKEKHCCKSLGFGNKESSQFTKNILARDLCGTVSGGENDASIFKCFSYIVSDLI